MLPSSGAQGAPWRGFVMEAVACSLSLSFPVVFKLFVHSFPSVTEMTIKHHENRTFDTMPLTLDSSHAPAPYVTSSEHMPTHYFSCYCLVFLTGRLVVFERPNRSSLTFTLTPRPTHGAGPPDRHPPPATSSRHLVPQGHPHCQPSASECQPPLLPHLPRHPPREWRTHIHHVFLM